MVNDLIDRARKKYLKANPLRVNELEAQTPDGKPAPPLTFPNLGDIQIIGCKLGMEYLAICHDEDAVEEWINTCISIYREPDWAGMLFANVSRGMNIVIGEMTNRSGLREHLQRQAVEAWNRQF